MFERLVITLRKRRFVGFTIKLQHANLVLIVAKKGYIVCGYINLKTCNKLKDAACVVTGVNKPQDMLSKKVEYLSKSARILGVRKGMFVKEALLKLS